MKPTEIEIKRKVYFFHDDPRRILLIPQDEWMSPATRVEVLDRDDTRPPLVRCDLCNKFTPKPFTLLTCEGGHIW